MTTQDFQQRIQDHYEDPYNRGRCVHPTHLAEAASGQCGHGDVVAIELRISDEQIDEAWFDGKGCQISQALASMLVERIESARIEDLGNWSLSTLLNKLEIGVEPPRHPCCQVALNALHAALGSPCDYDLDGPTFGGPDLGDEC